MTDAPSSPTPKTSATKTNPLLGFWHCTVHLWALSSLGIAQPLFRVTAENPSFFVVRGSQPEDLWTLVLTLGLLLPLGMATLVGAAWWVARPAGLVVHFLFVGLLVALYAAPALRLLDPFSGALAIAAMAVVGLLGVSLYAGSRPLRLLLSTAAPLVAGGFVALFVFGSPVKSVIFPAAATSSSGGSLAHAKQKPPISVIVLDECPSLSLMDAKGNLDAKRLPHLAKFAESATWYRNATSVATATALAVPSVLTGIRPITRLLPNVADHPDNLFTWLAEEYDYNVLEVSTYLCPDELSGRSESALSYGERMKSLFSDLGVVYLHVVTPASYTTSLPAIDNQWGDFARDAAATRAAAETEVAEPPPSPDAVSGEEPWKDIPDKKTIDERRDAILRGDRPAFFRDFVRGIENSTRPTVNFLHLMMPHTPWEYLPSGKKYLTAPHITGVSIVNDRWMGAPNIVAEYQWRHLLQMSYVDSLLGEFFDKLRREKLYDESLIVVVADHGIAYQAGVEKRRLSEAGVGEVMFVPLLVKLPGQLSGEVSEVHAEIVDILPTIASAMGLNLPWETDGRPLQQASQEKPAERTFLNWDASLITYSYDAVLESRQQALDRTAKHFQLGEADSDLFRFGPHRNLVGQSVQKLDIRVEAQDYELEQAALLERVDRSGAFVPARLNGRWNEPNDLQAGDPLALCLNGVIAGIATTYSVDGTTLFSGIVDDQYFVSGHNAVNLYRLESRDGQTLLLGPPGGSALSTVPAYAYDPVAGVLTSRQGSRYDLDSSGVVRGVVLDTDVIEDTVVFEGWGADWDRGQPADLIVAIDEQRVLFAGSLNTASRGIAKAFSVDENRLFGFRFVVPLGRLKEIRRLPTFLALSKNRQTVSKITLDPGVVRHLISLTGKRLWNDALEPGARLVPGTEPFQKARDALLAIAPMPFEVDLPRETLRGIQLTPSDKSCVLRLANVELWVNGERHSRLQAPEQLAPTRIDVLQTPDVFLDSGERLGYFRTKDLTPLDLSQATSATLRFELNTSAGDFSRVYFDTGDGFSSRQSIKVPLRRGMAPSAPASE